MEFDIQLTILSLIGGLVFGASLITLMFDSYFPLPPLSRMWKTYITLSILFFITYYGAIYANRVIDGNDLFHATPVSLIAYISFNIGMFCSSLVEEYRRRRRNGTKR